MVNEGLAKRAKEGVKVRQPLGLLEVTIDGYENGAFDEMKDILEDELNVKQVDLHYSEASDVKSLLLKLDMNITPELKREGLMREVIRHVQSARKKAGLNVDDRIVLSLATEGEDELLAAINEHEAMIAAETLADKIVTQTLAYEETVNVAGETLVVSLERID